MNSFPGQPSFHYQDHRLFVEQCNIAQLAEKYGSPLFIYSKKALEQAVDTYQTALATYPHLLCYAVKANSNLAILQLFARMGCGFDIVSGGELQRVLAAGAQASHIVFSGVGKTKVEMRQALQAGIKCFNVESIAEIDVLAQVAQEIGKIAPISLRVNPDVDAKTHPYISTGLKNNKFGIAFDQALSAYTYAAKSSHLQIMGIDCHIGSQITEQQPFLDALDRVNILIQQLQKNGIELHHIDLGGGLGITYQDEAPPAPQTLYAAIIERLKQHGLSHLELLVEPGRSLVGNAGMLVTQTLYLKPSETKNFCVVDAAMNDLPRPAMYDAYHEIIEVTQPTPTAQAAVYDVVGPICESGDWLGKERSLQVQQGDLLAILSAGAYNMSMASNYNSRGRAAEILVDGETAHLIRTREEIPSLYAHEHLLK